MSHQALSKTLYRTLLRTTKHYTSPTHGPILSSLIYRSGSDDDINYAVAKQLVSNKSDEDTSSSTHQDIDVAISIEEARDLSIPYTILKEQRKQREIIDHYVESGRESDSKQANDGPIVEEPLHIFLYKGLLREIIGSKAHMNFPSQVKREERSAMTRLKEVIKREFRGLDDSLSDSYSEKNRRDTAFLALKELQKKLVWAETLGLDLEDNEDKDDDEPKRKFENLVAKDIIPLPLEPASAYLKTGTLLVAHPLLTGCFAKSVICILQHTVSRPEDDGEKEDDLDLDESTGGTYGLIVNKSLKTGVPNRDSDQTRNRTLREVIRHDCLPEGIKVAFGDSTVRNGGPVNMSVQIIRTSTTDEEEKWKLGGTVLSMANDASSTEAETDIVKSTAIDTDSAIYFGGDIIKASQSVIDNGMQEESFSFVVGASCWEPGQLEGEIEKGYWIPCSGPPEITFSGSCLVHGAGNMRVSESSLWVSMMASLGEEEGRMAQIIEDFEYDENGLPCDEV